MLLGGKLLPIIMRSSVGKCCRLLGLRSTKATFGGAAVSELPVFESDLGGDCWSAFVSSCPKVGLKIRGLVLLEKYP